MKGIAHWVLFNGILVGSIYFGYVEHIENAARIAVFIAWFCFVCSLFMMADQNISIRAKNKSHVPKVIDYTFKAIIVFSFVWFGSVATGTAYFFYLLILCTANDAAEKLRAKVDTAD